ncbi:MAG: hypothetical protein KAT39_01055 [Alphaproteobacteria bacterium]|nr:hypothetical protein [Alphaproteobacteria bacterium]
MTALFMGCGWLLGGTGGMFIVNPLHARAISGLFSTHPPIGERIQRLREMAGQAPTGRGGPWG